MKDGTSVVNINENEPIEDYLIALYANGGNITYFDSFGVKYIPKGILKIISNKNIKPNIYRIQAND